MSSPTTRWLVFTITLLSAMSHCRSFQISMNYKPPVKSSVKKLHDRRFPSDQNGNKNRSSSTGKSAYANAYSLSSQAPQSFESRMRDLVLGQTQRTSTPVREGLPSNVHVIENLQDYKEVVGDEKEKIVAVRFYATYCRVSVSFLTYSSNPPISTILSLLTVSSGMQSSGPAFLSNSCQVPKRGFCGCSCFSEERSPTPRPRSAKLTLCAHLSSRWRSC